MTLLVALTTAISAILALPALAEGQLVAVPAGEHLLAFTLPEGFVAVDEGETIARLESELSGPWTQAITLTVDPSRAFQDPTMDISVLGGVMEALCPDTLDQTSLGSVDVPGTERSGYGGWNSCGTVLGSTPSRSEQQFSAAISGPSGMYVLTWIQHGPASAEELNVDNDTLDATFEILITGIKVCERVSGEVAPYSSCVGS